MYVIQKSNKYGLKQGKIAGIKGIQVVYVIQKSNKYGLKQAHSIGKWVKWVVYVIQKSNKYGLKQVWIVWTLFLSPLCMSFKKVTNTD